MAVGTTPSAGVQALGAEPGDAVLAGAGEVLVIRFTEASMVEVSMVLPTIGSIEIPIPVIQDLWLMQEVIQDPIFHVLMPQDHVAMCQELLVTDQIWSEITDQTIPDIRIGSGIQEM